VTIDFNSQSVAERLKQAGFDSAQPSCVIWEGVTNYLTDDSVDAVLRQIRQAAPAAIVLFTYVDRAVLETPEKFFGAQELMTRLRSYGEPWTFGLHPRELAEYLEARGLRLIQDVGVAEVWKRAGRQSSEVRGYEFYRVAWAQVRS